MENLATAAKRARKNIIEMHYAANDSHIGCSLCIVEILIALYFCVMKVEPARVKDPKRDRFVLSKGHAASALYAVMRERGFFSSEALGTFAKNGSRIPSHVERDALPGIETNGGSGGHGLSLGIGMALASRVDQNNARVFVLMGDGELQEGSVWEAAMFASSRSLSNLTLIVDRNMFQTWAKVDDVVALEPLAEKFKSFGWIVDEVDGHDIKTLAEILSKISGRPHVVIARTVKGKGISFMEGNAEWHNGVLTEEQYALAIKEV